jgi:hypothetical protein
VSASTRHFARHYVEMVAAMFLGMVVIGVPAVAALGVVGVSSSELEDDAPALLLFGMAVTMTAPMVAWMRYREHDWRPCTEMAVAMFVPTFGVIALLWSGLLEDIGTLLMIEHLVMLPSMLVAMLLRPDEYTGAVQHRSRRQATV